MKAKPSVTLAGTVEKIIELGDPSVARKGEDKHRRRCQPTKKEIRIENTLRQYLLSVLIILLSLGAGLGTATSQAQTSAYVTNLSGTVSVIDTTTNTVVATIPVGSGPVAVAITPVRQIPTGIEQCTHHGYLKFGPPAGPFKNQGQCVSYVEHH
jgi:YVTN family beta-propeller protein